MALLVDFRRHRRQLRHIVISVTGRQAWRPMGRRTNGDVRTELAEGSHPRRTGPGPWVAQDALRASRSVRQRLKSGKACSEPGDLGFPARHRVQLEADHIAAVSSIAARRTDVRDIVKHGLTWGLGHTLTLFVFAGATAIRLLGHAIPEHHRPPAGDGGRHHAGWSRRSRIVAAVVRPCAFSSA